MHIDHRVTQISLRCEHNTVDNVGRHRFVVFRERWLGHNRSDTLQSALQKRAGACVECNRIDAELLAIGIAKQRVANVQLPAARIGDDENER